MPRITPLPGWLAGLTLWLAAAIVEAQAKPVPVADRAFSSGLALGAAAGSEAPMFGGVVLYYLQFADPRLRVALHAGAGGVPSWFVTRGWGLAGGAFLAYGRHNRLVAGLSAGSQSWEQLTWYRTQLASRPLWGAGLSVGYEWMSSFGLFIRTSVGPSFYVRPERPLIRRKVYPSFQLGLTLGYKLW